VPFSGSKSFEQSSTGQSRVLDLCGLPTRRQLLVACLWAAVLTALVLLVQWLALLAVQQVFPQGGISFPFAIAPVTKAGDTSNLIGWGYFLNDSSHDPNLWALAVWVVVSLAAYRLFSGASILGLAGGTANLIELGINAFVLDWIIVPAGGEAINGYSVGDVLIFCGWGWMLGKFLWIVLQLVKALTTMTLGARTGVQGFMQTRTVPPPNTPPTHPTPDPSPPPSSPTAA
jgi:hypothetical protein